MGLLPITSQISFGTSACGEFLPGWHHPYHDEYRRSYRKVWTILPSMRLANGLMVPGYRHVLHTSIQSPTVLFQNIHGTDTLLCMLEPNGQTPC